MKKRIGALLAAGLMLLAGTAMGEIGFAEVAKDRVNFRNGPGGKTIAQFDAPQSVFVFEEKVKDDQLWCHVTTHRGKDNVSGWIRGDMLRFLGDEFTDITFVQAGNHYVTGLREDGTVAIMGNDMPHAPCIEAVRHWGEVEQVASWVCEVFGLTKDGRVLAAGRNTHMAGTYATTLGTHMPILLDGEGRYIADRWVKSNGLVPEGIEDVRFAEIVGAENIPMIGLSKGGELIALGDARFAAPMTGGTYTDIDLFNRAFVALRADGRVEASGIDTSLITGPGKDKPFAVEDWTDVIAVSVGDDFALGLKRDGTVYFAGADEAHRRQVESLSDVVQIDAGAGYAIALKRDGSVAMTGCYDGYDR